MTSALRSAQQPHSEKLDESRLRELIAERSFAKGDFVLSSGKKSNFYFNLKPTMMTPEGAYLSAEAFLRRLGDAQFIGGLEMGAVPIIAAVAALAHKDRKSVGTFFVRKKAKEHGAQLLVEGLAKSESLRGKRVIIADDVTTSGQSVLKAVEAARAEGAIVERALSLVDRQEGAEELLRREGVALSSVFTVADFA